jgi:hypothetical protein
MNELSVRAALAVVAVLFAAACSGGGKAASTNRSTEITLGPDQVPHARLHVAYPFDLYTHCGVRDATFAGRDWVVVPPVTPASKTQPPVTGSHGTIIVLNTTHGTMTRLGANVAVFRTAEGLVARFRPLRRGEDILPCA